MTNTEGSLLRWWRYFLIFMGVSFGKVKAVHALTDQDKESVAKWQAALRRVANEPSVLLLVKSEEFFHVNQEIWKGMDSKDSSLSRYRAPEFTSALVKAGIPLDAAVFLSGRGGGKIAFSQKPMLWSHREKNAHRFAIAGEEYVERELKVAFDPDSEIRGIEIGMPVKNGTEVIASLIAFIPYRALHEIN